MGASCNFMIAASRLGLRVGCAGHCGDDVYGDFLRGILAVGFSMRACTGIYICRRVYYWPL